MLKIIAIVAMVVVAIVAVLGYAATRPDISASPARP
jgi:L-asparagine transporter-like permease